MIHNPFVSLHANRSLHLVLPPHKDTDTTNITIWVTHFSPNKSYSEEEHTAIRYENREMLAKKPYYSNESIANR